MYKEIKIGGQSVELLSNAATPIWYHQIFKKDVVKNLVDSQEDRTIAVNMAPELAFVMMHQAAKHDMNALNVDHFVEWLETFGAMDFLDSNDLIWEVYYGNAQTASTPKKKRSAQPKEK